MTGPDTRSSDVIALFDVDGTLTLPRLVRLLFLFVVSGSG